jgi:hypothetical protein
MAAPAAAATWTWPVRGEVITPYRNGGDPYAGRQHRGIDIAGPVGAPVAAAAGGTVRFVGSAGWSGITVTVRTSDGRYDTSYLHLSEVAVREGGRVAAGQPLGAVGASGRPSDPRPHLHFGIRDAGSRHSYRDPLDFLPRPPRRVPEAPRGAPAPVAAPLTRGPALHPIASPRPLHRPVPAARGLPAGRLVPRGLPVGALAPGGAREASPELPLPTAHPASSPAGESLRHPGGAADPAARGARSLGVAPGHGDAAARRIAAGTPPPRPDRARGPDLGLALACLGLLLAAGCVGGTPEGRATAARGRARLAALLRPLGGRA